jgi:hypothetical protein
MSVQISEEEIKEIAGWLEVGMACFYNKKDGTFEYYPNELRNPYNDDFEENWADIKKKIKSNKRDYIEIEDMSSREGFWLMESFVNEINDLRTRGKFLDAISQKKPFQQFNSLISYYPELRNEWFKFKTGGYIAFVKEQIL